MEMVCNSKTIIVQQVCDTCNNGVMVYNGNIIEDVIASAKMFQHECPVCGYKRTFPNVYPINRVLPVESLREPADDEKV